jgi:RimJ/RimL family protein N-acetyltransferase
MLPEHFETARLYARPPRVEDAEAAFAAYAADPEVTRYVAWKPHRELSTVRAYFGACAHHWRTTSGLEGNYPWLLFLRDTNALVGSISVELEIPTHSAMFGYVLARPHWGHGLTTEALRYLVDWALAQPKIFRTWAVCDVDNPASARVMEKAGMTREGILRRWHMAPTISSEPRDCFCYAKVR